jgi:hypothetical protein
VVGSTGMMLFVSSADLSIDGREVMSLLGYGSELTLANILPGLKASLTMWICL